MEISQDVMVVVPIYKGVMSSNEKISFERIMKVFSSRSINLVAPFHLKEFCHTLCEKYKNLTVSYFKDVFFQNIRGYNRLLMNIDFYVNYLNYEFILICQLDVYVLKDDIDYWMNKKIDNIGAPIFSEYSKTQSNDEYKELGNNGGFCLRNVHKCIKVLSKKGCRYYQLKTLMKVEKKWNWRLFRLIRDGLVYNYKIGFLKPIINEDIFWSMIIPLEFDFFTSCLPSEAKYFAYDANPKLLFEKSKGVYPMAIHAWWRYDEDFVLSILEKGNFK